MAEPKKFLDNLSAFADALDRAARFGGAKDEPEGNRFIQMSDTMATALAKELREVFAEQLQWRSGRVWTPEGAEASPDSDMPPTPEEMAEAIPAQPSESDPAAGVPARPSYTPITQPLFRPTARQVPRATKGTIRRFKNEDY